MCWVAATKTASATTASDWKAYSLICERAQGARSIANSVSKTTSARASVPPEKLDGTDGTTAMSAATQIEDQDGQNGHEERGGQELCELEQTELREAVVDDGEYRSYTESF